MNAEEEAGLVGWELIAMAGMSNRLRADRSLSEDHLARTAFLESFLTHVRILTEFFMGRLNKRGERSWRPDTDLVPHDMVNDWEPPATGAQLDSALPRIDAHLSHLSRKRLDANEAWGYVGLAETVLAVASEFDEALRREEGSPHAVVFHEWRFLAGQVLANGFIDDPPPRP